MDYKLDLKEMVKSFKKAAPDNGVLEFIETEGEQYIFENIFTKLSNGERLRISDIDFDAFDEDDITDIIDYKIDKMENKLRGSINIANIFITTPPLAVKSRRFF